uniref:trihelix transcription factor GT-3a-like n=1 Tax=Erigeron canadensis TaxID=72917 RepID=UPI001CB8A1E4|nr:trihelix transcription factor GT-3a-like [Erigeron canadensis]
MEHGGIYTTDPSIHSGVGGERFTQWSVQETRDFLMMRAELDQTFMETKRNKLLWEVIAKKMNERGYNRSAEQCKAKWKNLVTRYKGCEAVEHDGMRQQFPHYNDMQAIFSARMQRMLWMEAEGVASGSKKRMMELSSDDDEPNEESHIEKTNKKLKTTKSSRTGNNPSSSIASNLKEILDEFMKQQMHIEKQWMEIFEAKEEERRSKEIAWQEKMEVLANERRMLDQRWREREEQRMVKEEVRSQKWDALVTELLEKIRSQDM